MLNPAKPLTFSILTICISVACILPAVAAENEGNSKPNILWLSTEDIGPQLPCYGDTTIKTPNLDALASRGMVYDYAWSNYPVCAPARTTIITGMYAASNGAGHMRSLVPLPKQVKMFPQILRESGYACFNNSKEDYNHPKTGKVWNKSARKAHYKDSADQPFFSVFNNTQTHESRIRNRPHEQVTLPKDVQLLPYWPDLPEVRQDWAQYYDNLIKMDKWVGNKLKELEAAGKSENTIVVFFGDHGSGMPRHKRYAGDSGMRVPMIVYVPEKLKHLAPKDYVPGGHSKRPVGFVDLAPTMLSIADIPAPDYMQGSAFMGHHQKPAPKYLYGCRDRMDERIDFSRSIRDERFLYIRNFMTYLPAGQELSYQMKTPTTAVWKKLFDQGNLNEVQSAFWQPHPSEELYDLVADPHATRNLIDAPEKKADLNRMRKAMRDKAIEVRDAAFIPESIAHQIQATQPVYEFCSDSSKYPIAQVFDLACAASSNQAYNSTGLPEAAKSSNAIFRYWAAMGILNRGKKAAIANADLLQRLVNDSSPAVAIVAAESLAKFGSDSARKLALSKLAEHANSESAQYFSALHAYNAISRLGPIADPIMEKIRNPHVQPPKMSRGGNYVARMIDHLFPAGN